MCGFQGRGAEGGAEGALCAAGAAEEVRGRTLTHGGRRGGAARSLSPRELGRPSVPATWTAGLLCTHDQGGHTLNLQMCTSSYVYIDRSPRLRMYLLVR